MTQNGLIHSKTKQPTNQPIKKQVNSQMLLMSLSFHQIILYNGIFFVDWKFFPYFFFSFDK